ncbi:hypothetical protein DH2020_035694 [Rehmannia glutinosa]|uniref:Ubiquitin-fold modifier-conjugating enzyme 1 n=1 Tax=Rehmannia glutinosa TaxID=99300 RepID=A0ABR0V7H2_REHGL
MEGWDPTTKSTLTQIPLLSVKAGPRDGGAWTQRLKEEYKALIAYTSMNKSKDNDWFRISAANPEGTRWTGKCWYVHNLLKYEFDLQFDIPVTYPATAPELELPELDGKTQRYEHYAVVALQGYCPLPLCIRCIAYNTILILVVIIYTRLECSVYRRIPGYCLVKLPMYKSHRPRFGIAHALCLGLAPWLAAEIPILVDSGMIKHKDDVAASSESS